MIRHLPAVAAASLSMIAVDAAAQSGAVIMRRPIPLTAGRADIPSGNVPGTPPGTGADTPEEIDKVVSPPEKTVCDETADPAETKLTAVRWVENGWSNGGMSAESCSIQKMTYVCEATYTCDIGGRKQSFVSVAPDSVCEGSKDEVQYPGDTPDPTRFPSDRSTADQATWYIAKIDNAVRQQQSGGASAVGGGAVRSAPWFRGVDQIKWWTPGEYSPWGHLNYIRVFIDPGGSGLYDANSELCGQMRAAGHPCSNYYSHEGGSVFIAWILG